MTGHNFFYQKIKNRVSSRLLAKIRVSQVFWEPIKNRASPRSALLEAVYLEALLYIESEMIYLQPLGRLLLKDTSVEKSEILFYVYFII